MIALDDHSNAEPQHSSAEKSSAPVEILYTEDGTPMLLQPEGT